MSVRLSAWDNLAPIGWSIMNVTFWIYVCKVKIRNFVNFEGSIFLKSVEKIDVWLTSDKNNG